MNFLFKNSTVLHPEDSNELQSWSKKWNITISELGRAIVDTGSTNIRDLKKYIRKNKSHSQHSTSRYPGLTDLAISR